MSAWRGFAERKATRDSQEAFQMLNMNDGSAWELLTSLMQYQPNDRLSASAALRHRWFGSSLLAPVGAAFDRVASSVGQVIITVIIVSVLVAHEPAIAQHAVAATCSYMWHTTVLFACWHKHVVAYNVVCI